MEMNKKLSMLLAEIQRKSSESLTRISKRPDDFSAMATQLIALIVLLLIAVYYYGARAAVVAGVTVGTALVLDAVCIVIRGKKLHIHDISAVITGLTLALMMPASVPYTVAAAAAAFSICIAKHPFGGHGNELFSCSAAGYIFAVLSFPTQMLSYPKPFTYVGLENTVTEPLFSSFSKSMTFATNTNTGDFELLIGRFIGPMGATAIILLIVCALVLMFRRAISSLVFIYELGTIMVYKLASGGFEGAKLSLAGGMLIFGIMFLTCDISVTPRSNGSCILFGVICGLMVIFFEMISTVENPVVYAAVICAPIARLLDRADLSERRDTRSRRKRSRDIMAAVQSEEKNQAVSNVPDRQGKEQQNG
ncbi:MAG: RnfABCDGE type electron transport complex subunit D [Huintestinicola sp.]